MDAPRLETKALSSSVLPPSYASDRPSGNNRALILKPRRSHRKAAPDAARRPRLLEMHRGEPAPRAAAHAPAAGSFRSESHWRKSSESGEGCSEAAGNRAERRRCAGTEACRTQLETGQFSRSRPFLLLRFKCFCIFFVHLGVFLFFFFFAYIFSLVCCLLAEEQNWLAPGSYVLGFPSRWKSCGICRE